MVISVAYVVSTSLTKISILLFYKRMSDGAVSRTFRYAVRACIAFVVAYMITFVTTLFLTCRPINSYWNQVSLPWAISHEEYVCNLHLGQCHANSGIRGTDYHCFNEPADLLAASAVSIVQDFIVCGMPTLLFWKLRLPRRQKIALAAVFGVGFLYAAHNLIIFARLITFRSLCVTGILRIIYITVCILVMGSTLVLC